MEACTDLSPLHTTQQMMRLLRLIACRCVLAEPDIVVTALPDRSVVAAGAVARRATRGGTGARGAASSAAVVAGWGKSWHTRCCALRLLLPRWRRSLENKRSGNNLTGGSELWLLAHFFAGAACQFPQAAQLDSRSAYAQPSASADGCCCHGCGSSRWYQWRGQQHCAAALAARFCAAHARTASCTLPAPYSCLNARLQALRSHGFDTYGAAFMAASSSRCSSTRTATAA